MRFNGERSERGQFADLAEWTPTDHDSWTPFQNKKALLFHRFSTWKETLKCQDCGLSFKGAPGKCTFHHIDPEHKVDNISTMINDGCHIADIMDEIDKCSIICTTCHRIEHHRLDGNLLTKKDD